MRQLGFGDLVFTKEGYHAILGVPSQEGGQLFFPAHFRNDVVMDLRRSEFHPITIFDKEETITNFQRILKNVEDAVNYHKPDGITFYCNQCFRGYIFVFSQATDMEPFSLNYCPGCGVSVVREENPHAGA